VGEERRKATTLAILTLVFIPLAAIAVFLNPIALFLAGNPVTPPAPPVLIAFVIVFIAYAVSRTTYYPLGSYLIISTPIVAVVGTALNSPNAVSLVALFYITLAVILSSLLLDARGTLITGAISVILVILLQVIRPAEGQAFQWAIVSFVIVSTSVMALMGRVRGQYVVALESTQKQLQQRIIEVDQARAQAERSDQVKSAFLASMSHELRTPMNAVINFTQFVVDGDTGPVNEEQKELLMEVIGSATHLLNLINDVLDMSKIEAGSLKLFIEDGINVNAILNSVLSTGRGLLKSKDKLVQIETNIPDDLPLIRADRQRILQIMLNIVSNACKFTDEGHIKIQAQQLKDKIKITVSDTGPGISPEDQAAVFEAFKQTTTGLRQAGGTGLGMPIAKSLAEAHGGDLWLESEPGKGAIFHVMLPVKSEALALSLG
jgi:signal transduction histidine kinase